MEGIKIFISYYFYPFHVLFYSSIFLKINGDFFILFVLKILEIFSADSGINGLRSFEISLRASTNSYKTFLSLVSHGFLFWIYSLQISKNANISFKALSILNSSKYSFIFLLFNFLIKVLFVFSIPYFSANAETLETKFPSLFASSLLWRSIKDFDEKSPSSPKEDSLNKKYLAESTPAILTNSSTFITFPRDFEIF